MTHSLLRRLAAFSLLVLIAGVQQVQAQVWPWAADAHSSNGFYTQCIGRDSLGNVYVMGEFTDSLAIGSSTLTTTPDGTIGSGRARGGHPFVAKINALTGQWEWTRRLESSAVGAHFWIRDFACTPGGEVYMVGYISALTGSSPISITFGAHTLSTTESKMGYVAKLGPTGTWEWAHPMTHRRGGLALAQSVAADRAGNVVVGGYFNGSQLNLDFTTLSGDSGAYTGFVAKYSAAGVGLWAVGMRGKGGEGSAVGLDSTGNVYLKGRTFGDTVRLGPHTAVGHYGSNTFLAKLSADGTQWHWVKMIPRMASAGVLPQLAVDAAGNVVVYAEYGSSQAPNGVDLDPHLLPTDTTGAFQHFIAFLTTQGQWRWVMIPGSPLTTRIENLAVRASGVFVTGSFQCPSPAPAYFGSVPLYASDSIQPYVAHLFSSTGDPIWVVPLNGRSHAMGRAVLPTATGDVILTGNFQHTLELGGLQLQRPVGGPYALPNLFVARLHPTDSLGLLGFSPRSGAPGQQVALAADQFGRATAVYFNGTLAPVMLQVAPGSLVVEVPAGATTGRITVTTVLGLRTSETDFVITGPTGFANAPAAGQWRLTPNPAAGQLYVSAPEAPTQPIAAALLDVSGRPVRTWLLAHPTQTVSLHGLPAGVYTFRAGPHAQRLVVFSE